MNAFSNLKIRTKLMYSFLLLAVFAGIVGWLGLSNISQLSAQIDGLRRETLVPIRELGYANAAFLRGRVDVRDMVIKTDRGEQRELQRAVEQGDREFDTRLQTYRATQVNKQESEILAQIDNLLPTYRRDRGVLIDAALAGKQKEATALLYGAVRKSQAELREDLRRLIDLNAKLGDESADQAMALAASRQQIMLVVLGLALVISVVLALLISKAISRPIHSLAAASTRLAEGDVNVQIDASGQDELGDLSRAFSAMAAMIADRARAADQIAAGNLEIEVRANSDRDTLARSFTRVLETLRRLVAEARQLSAAAVEGRLEQRGDVNAFQGGYRDILEGVNRTLDSVLQPINEAAGVIARIAQKDLTARVDGQYRGDHAAIKNNINRMAEDLRTSISQITRSAGSLASAAEELTAVSQQMSSNAEETSAQANLVSAASDQVSKNVSVVATGSEEMQSSIREIAKNSNESAQVARRAVGVAQDTNRTIGKLGESSTQIGQVIKVITSIAQQTNLLALNATIEAARAGEAGKGFAVVANEVKELAKQTANATEDIGQKIEAIQTDTGGAVKAIEEISGIINQISDISNNIASAVEQQTVTTNEIGRNVSEAARGTGEIARNIAGVAEAAKDTSQGSSQTEKAASALSSMASELQGLVAQFRL
jgi:methyl-accepting chemotaxis protein